MRSNLAGRFNKVIIHKRKYECFSRSGDQVATEAMNVTKGPRLPENKRFVRLIPIFDCAIHSASC